MVRFINGEHSTPPAQPSCYSLNLSIVRFKCSPNRLPSSPELQDLKCEHAIISHPLPSATLLEIPLWRWQYPDSLVQLHFKDLITPVDTVHFFVPLDSPCFYLADWLPGFDLITDLVDMFFFFFSFSLLACLSVPISVFLSSSRGVKDRRDTR